MRQAAVLFSDTGKSTMSPQIRGGKGYNLAQMAALGLPVPPGFTIPTGVCRAYREHGCLPKRLQWHIQNGLAELEKAIGRRFGDEQGPPLLVSVRSGAADSMPGMMDTILNVGFNRLCYQRLANQFGQRFAREVYGRFVRQLAGMYDFNSRIFDAIDEQFESDKDWLDEQARVLWVVRDGLLEDPQEQLLAAITGVFDSWNSERAVAYRDNFGLPHWQGTAVNIQAMVYGNMDERSCTGVVFSHDANTGAPGMSGEFLVQAQGEDIVSGVRTPSSIADMADWDQDVYDELNDHVAMLSERLGGIVDVEFTVESGRLYILQVRKATRSPQAAASFAVHQVWTKKWSHEQAVASLTETEIKELDSSEIAQGHREMFDERLLASGLAACRGVASGYVARTNQEAIEMNRQGKPVILVRQDTSPEDLPGMLVSGAIVTAVGGATCHAAVVARGLGIPAVVGAGDLKLLVNHCDTVTVDGGSGQVAWGQYALEQVSLPKEANIFLKWVERFSRPKPRLVFEKLVKRESANQMLNNFYLSDAMAALAAGSPLERRAQQLREYIHCDTAETLATYLALALAEVRHYWDAGSESKPEEAQRIAVKLAETYNLPTTRHTPRQQYQEAIVRTLDYAALEHQIGFAELAEQLFDIRAVWSPAIGGPAWGRIARALKRFLNGELNHSVFVDHVFDLRHNGGRLFDKHPMVSVLTDDHQIVRQLDIKKHSQNLRETFADLMSHGIGNDVAQLFGEGKAARLW